MDTDLLTATEAGEILGRSRATVIRWANDPDHPLQGHRRVDRFGQAYFVFRRADVEAIRATAEVRLHYPDARRLPQYRAQGRAAS
jgi:hypothetical protein